MKTKQLALAAIIAALYAALTLGLAPISFMDVQVRVAEALKLLVYVFPLETLVGSVIGMFVANSFSPLGAIDLISPLVAGGLLVLMWKLRGERKRELLGAGIYVGGISAWVAFMLTMTFGLPFLVSFPLVAIGQSIAVFGLGIPVLTAVRKYAPAL